MLLDSFEFCWFVPLSTKSSGSGERDLDLQSSVAGFSISTLTLQFSKQFGIYVFIPIGMFWYFNLPSFYDNYVKEAKVCNMPEIVLIDVACINCDSVTLYVLTQAFSAIFSATRLLR